MHSSNFDQLKELAFSSDTSNLVLAIQLLKNYEFDWKKEQKEIFIFLYSITQPSKDFNYVLIQRILDACENLELNLNKKELIKLLKFLYKSFTLSYSVSWGGTEKLSFYDYDSEKMINKVHYLVKELFQFSLEDRKSIVLQHYFFHCLSTKLIQMSGMPCDEKDNLHDMREDSLGLLCEHAIEEFKALEESEFTLEEVKSIQQHHNELYTFYKIPQLKYFNDWSLNRLHNNHNYFYRAQQAEQEQEWKEALEYYDLYLQSSSQTSAKNNYILNDMVLENSNYTPSPLLALKAKAKIHQHLQQDESRRLCYFKCIALDYNHHQTAHLEMALLLQEEKANPKLIFRHFEQHYLNILATKWQNPQISHYHLVEIGEQRQKAYKANPYAYAEAFKDNNDLSFRDYSTYFIGCLQKPLLQHLTTEDYDLAFEYIKLIKKVQSDWPFPQNTFDDHKAYGQDIEPLFEEDILYYQALCAVKLFKDYWQARSLLRKTLKISPLHRLAKELNQEIQTHLN